MPEDLLRVQKRDEEYVLYVPIRSIFGKIGADLLTGTGIREHNRDKIYGIVTTVNAEIHKYEPLKKASSRIISTIQGDMAIGISGVVENTDPLNVTANLTYAVIKALNQYLYGDHIFDALYMKGKRER